MSRPHLATGHLFQNSGCRSIEDEDLRHANTLGSLLPDHTAKVVECFAKMTDSALKNDAIYMIQSDQAKTILRAGLKSSDESVRENAERARENLLRGGRFDFLELDD